MKFENYKIKANNFGKITDLSLTVSLNKDVVQTWVKRFQDLLEIKDFDSLTLEFIPVLSGSKKLQVKTTINYLKGEDYDGPQAA